MVYRIVLLTHLLALSLVTTQTAQAESREIVGAFWYQGPYSCRLNVSYALQYCQQRLTAYMHNTPGVVDGECSFRDCSCRYGTFGNEAVCPAWVKLDQPAPCEQPRRRAIRKTTYGVGNSCAIAVHEAKKQLFAWAKNFSGQNFVTHVRLGWLGDSVGEQNCYCDYYGIPRASCSATIQYLQCPADNDDDQEDDQESSEPIDQLK